MSTLPYLWNKSQMSGIKYKSHKFDCYTMYIIVLQMEITVLRMEIIRSYVYSTTRLMQFVKIPEILCETTDVFLPLMIASYLLQIQVTQLVTSKMLPESQILCREHLMCRTIITYNKEIEDENVRELESE